MLYKPNCLAFFIFYLPISFPIKVLLVVEQPKAKQKKIKLKFVKERCAVYIYEAKSDAIADYTSNISQSDHTIAPIGVTIFKNSQFYLNTSVVNGVKHSCSFGLRFIKKPKKSKF